MRIFKACKLLIDGHARQVFKGMATLALGSGIAKIISIAAIPILTRLYAPADFGVLAIFSAVVMMISPMLTLRYVLALPLPRNDGTAFNLLVLSTIVMLILTFILALLLMTFGEAVLALISMEVLAQWWWLIILALLVSATYEMLTLWATRRRNYVAIAKTNVWQNILGSLTKILLGMLGVKPLGLLVGQVFSQGGGMGALLKCFAQDFKHNRRHLRWSRMHRAAFRYRDFPIYRVPSQLLLILSAQSPLFFMAALYDANTTGQLGLALTAMGLPLQLFGTTLAKAFYAEAAKLGTKQPEKVRKMAVSVVKRLAFFSIPPAFILFLYGAPIFTLVFGDDWKLAGVFSSILAVYLVFQFVQTPVAHIFFLFDGQKKLLLLNIQRAALVVICFGISYYMDLNPVNTIWFYALVLSVHYILSTIYALKFIPSIGKGHYES